MTSLLQLVEDVPIEATGEMAAQGKKVLSKVRRAMLAPTSVKEAPRLSIAQLASLVNLEQAQIHYRIKKGELPGGELNAAGTRREFQLGEARQWTRVLRSDRMRPAEAAEAITIALANFKGGSSKTTSAMTLAQGLSLRGHRVLVVDCDPQGSLTTLFGILSPEIEDEQTILPLCEGTEETIDYAIRPTYWDGIDLVPARPTVFAAEFHLPARQSREANFQFWNVLNYGLEQARQVYDVVVIDTPPALSYTTINAMMAADGLIMPLPPNALDFASSVEFWELFHDLTKELIQRGKGKRFQFIDVLLSKVDGNDIATSVVREWITAAYGERVLPIEIPKTATAASASAEFGTIYDMKSGAAASRTIKRAADAYDKFVDTVEAQLVSAWMRQVQSQVAEKVA